MLGSALHLLGLHHRTASYAGELRLDCQTTSSLCTKAKMMSQQHKKHLLHIGVVELLVCPVVKISLRKTFSQSLLPDKSEEEALKHFIICLQVYEGG
jgi:hypothetical protein